MKRTAILVTGLLVAGSLQAQKVGEIKLFKNKEAKVRSHNLHDLQITEDGKIELTAFLKKKQAEKVVFSPELALEKKEEVDFDFDEDEKKRGFRFFDYSYNKSEIIKTDVLDVQSSDIISKMFKLDLIAKGRVGMKTGMGFKVKKGDIALVQYENQESSQTFSINSWGIYTAFIAKDEIKLKSDEGKNLTYEFHSSKGEYIQESMNQILAKSLSKMKKKKSDHTNDSEIEKSIKDFKGLTSADADLLVITKRNPIFKFGKAPTAEEQLPVYYAFQISPKTMDIVAQTKFAEPVSRAIVFREALKKNKGVLLISAPNNLVKPKDENPRNYVFRHIGDDTQIKFEFNYEVPSGFTQFSHALELADGSIVLLAGICNKKQDKYMNQGFTTTPDDAFYTMTIKDGKVIHAETFTADNFINSTILPEGDKVNKYIYTPTLELSDNIATEQLPGGGFITFYTLLSKDSKGSPIYAGDVALQFSATGKLEAKYWVESKEPAFKRPTQTAVIKNNDNEFYWLIFDPTYQKEEYRTIKGVASKTIAGYGVPAIIKLNTGSKTLSKKTMVGDEKHFVGESYPYFQTADKELQFFGFDKGGKEFWTQKVEL